MKRAKRRPKSKAARSAELTRRARGATRSRPRAISAIAAGGTSSWILQGDAAFARDLPTLLVEHPGQWVAYRGRKRIGIATSKFALYAKCRRLAIPEDELVVRCIESWERELAIGLPGIETPKDGEHLEPE